MRHRKINDDTLKKMVAEGLYAPEIAQRFDCSPSLVIQRIKTIGLTPNYCRRGPKGGKQASAPRQADVPVRGDGAPQVVPITLKFTIDVYVRVHTEAA